MNPTSLVLSLIFVSPVWLIQEGPDTPPPAEAVAENRTNQERITIEEFGQLSGTYGFLLGQQASIELASARFPQFSKTIELSRVQFEASFGPARDSMVERMKRAVGDDWEALHKKMKVEIDAYLAKTEISEADVPDFTRKLGERAKGKFESPYVETLLAHHPLYTKLPAQEFADGFRRVFLSEDHPKAKGLHLKLTLPQSWMPSEGERPNIVQKFRSGAGHGPVELLLQVMNAPTVNGRRVTDAQLRQSLLNDPLEDFAPDGCSMREGKRLKIEGLPAIRMTLELTEERLDTRLSCVMEMLIVCMDSKLVYLNSSVGGPAKEIEQTRRHHTKYLPVVRQIQNSLVWLDAYAR